MVSLGNVRKWNTSFIVVLEPELRRFGGPESLLRGTIVEKKTSYTTSKSNRPHDEDA